jgi:antitoxin HigA-1
MSRAPARIGMAPPHPGAFIREEILDEIGLTVSEAAKVLDVRRATLSDLFNGTRRCRRKWRCGSRRRSA